MMINGASFKIVNAIASGLKHESNSITGKLLHNAQVTYKAHGPLVVWSDSWKKIVDQNSLLDP